MIPFQPNSPRTTMIYDDGGRSGTKPVMPVSYPTNMTWDSPSHKPKKEPSDKKDKEEQSGQ